MERIKTMFFVVGVSCSGKSYYANKLAEKLCLPLSRLDGIYSPPIPTTPEKLLEKYNYMMNWHQQDIFIAEGFMPFTEDKDRVAFKEVLGDNIRVIYIVVKPSFEIYQRNIEERRKINALFYILDEQQYEKRYEDLADEIDRPFIEFRKDSDLDMITENDINILKYQKTGVTDIRWNQLQIDCKGKSVLDIGCCCGFYETYTKRQGVEYYSGIDLTPISKYISPKISIRDANNIADISLYDIVISTSMFHYIYDKEKFIKECSEITKELFLLETPVSEIKGTVIELIQTDLYKHLMIPSKEMIEFWISKYFKSFECLGEGISENGSKRLIFKCHK